MSGHGQSVGERTLKVRRQGQGSSLAKGVMRSMKPLQPVTLLPPRHPKGSVPEELSLPPWPMHIRIDNCNVDITDAPPEGAEMEGMDTASPNPFLPSLMTIQDGGGDSKVCDETLSGGGSGSADKAMFTRQCTI